MLVASPAVRPLLVTVGLAWCAAVPAAQSSAPMSEAAVRTVAREALSRAKGDNTELVLAFDRRVRERWGDFESFPISIVKREDLHIILSAPFMRYRLALVEHLRMREPLDKVPWSGDIVIAVSPERLTAPDVTAVVVHRGGTTVVPLANQLRPMTFTSGSGDSATLHAGDLRFAASAFAPGAAVTVTARPAVGEPMTFLFSEAQLRILK